MEPRRSGAEAQMEIDHLAIAVKSMERALVTFNQIWDLEPDHMETGETDKITEAMLPLGDAHLQLLEPTDEPSTVAKLIEKRGQGMHHIAIRVPDIEAAMERLRANGAELIDEKWLIGGGGHKVAF